MGIYNCFSSLLLQDIDGISYVGCPKNRTMMYLSKKIEKEISKLEDVSGCLVFLQQGIEIPEKLNNEHTFIVCDDPRAAYAEAAIQLAADIEDDYRKKRYENKNGCWMGENVHIGTGVSIEPGAFIDHDVEIGRRVIIKSGARIRRKTRVGDDCVFSENCVIGGFAFNFAELSSGKKVMIPNFGGVNIGNQVYIGPGSVVSCGSSDNTIIEDNVKIGALANIGHDVHLHNNVEVRTGASISGFCDVGEGSVIAVNAALKNRLSIGEKCLIGIGSVALKNAEAGRTFFGIPAMKIL